LPREGLVQWPRTNTTAGTHDPECVFSCPRGSLDVASPGDIPQIKESSHVQDNMFPLGVSFNGPEPKPPLEHAKIANMSSGVTSSGLDCEH
jgi:hypothetical protein